MNWRSRSDRKLQILLYQLITSGLCNYMSLEGNRRSTDENVRLSDTATTTHREKRMNAAGRFEGGKQHHHRAGLLTSNQNGQP